MSFDVLNWVYVPHVPTVDGLNAISMW
jgi:hypothetical protein